MPSDRLAVVTFYWPDGGYGPTHVNNLRGMVRRNCMVPHDFYCVTNHPQGIDPFVKVIRQWPEFVDWGRCYRRLKMFSREIAEVIPHKRIMMLDLDQVITADLTDIVQRPDPFTIWQCSSVSRRGHAFNPSFLIMETGCKHAVWEEFIRSPDMVASGARACGWTGSDQAVLGLLLHDPIAVVTKEDGLLSWRDDRPYPELPPGTRLVSFYGCDDDPSKDATQGKARWVPRHWRNLRMDILDALIETCGWNKGAELGVLNGQTFFYLLDRNPKLSLIGVDAWTYGDGPMRSANGYRSLRNYPLEQYEREVKTRAADYGDRAKIMHTTTVEAAKAIPDESLDFVFVDADHTQAGVQADIASWYPKIRPGGWMLGHDIHFPSVRAAVEYFFPHWQAWPDKVWSVEKPT